MKDEHVFSKAPGRREETEQNFGQLNSDWKTSDCMLCLTEGKTKLFSLVRISDGKCSLITTDSDVAEKWRIMCDSNANDHLTVVEYTRE